jgi:hypothetical protein
MRSARALAALAVALGLALDAAPAGAFEEMQGARAIAMGGALRAAAAASAAPYLNPAALSLLRAYVVEAAYELRAQDTTSIVGASITDSATSRVGVAAGLYYTFLNGEPKLGTVEYTRRGHEVGLAMSYPLADRLLLGVTNKYFYQDTTAGDSPLPGARNHGYTVDVGLLLRATDSICLTAVGQNLVDEKSWEAPPTLAFGLAFGAASVFMLDFDGVIRWLEYPGRATQPVGSYHVGAEYFFGGAFPLRLGYSYDLTYRTLMAMTDPAVSESGDSFFHGGVGYLTPAFGLEFGARQQLSGPDRETLLSFALKLFVQ